MDYGTELYNRLRGNIMKKIYVVGENGFARECYNYLIDINKINPEIVFAGFLGHGGYGHTVDYLNLQKFYKGEVSEHKFSENDYVVIGAGYPKLRSKIYYDLKAMGLNFYTLITVNSYINELVDIGEGNIFNETNITSPHIKIGNANLFNDEIIIGHDVEVGDFNFFGPRSQLLGNVKVGDMNQIGANSVLLPGAKIGSYNKIAPLSSIYKGCKDNCYMLGNPALKIGAVS